MTKIEYIQASKLEESTKIPMWVFRFIETLYELNYIENGQPLNAEFLNKYHFELYEEDLRKIADKIFKDGEYRN